MQARSFWARRRRPSSAGWASKDGLPVGLQIVGRRFDDLGVLQMSAAFEAARPWASLRPPFD